MAFVNPNPSNNRFIISSGNTGARPNLGSPYTFPNAIGSILRPGVNLNAEVTVNIGGSGSSSNGSNGGSGSGSGKSPKGGRPHRNSDRGYFPSSPIRTNSISLNTGISSGTIIDPFEQSSSNFSSNLYLLGGSFFKTGKSSVFQRLLSEDVYFKVVTKVQASVNYRASDYLKVDQFTDYISNLSSALQLYYSVDSILVYELNSPNTNDGMRKLRSMLTAELLSQHERLKRTLLQMVIPPNILGVIAYMYQVFRFDNTPYSPLYKLEYRSLFHSSSPQSLSVDYYDIVIKELMDGHRINSLLLKTFPSFQVNELPPSSAVPIYDKNFLSFWYNSTCCYLNNETLEIAYTKTCENSFKPLYYGHFCDSDIDGLFYSFFSVYDQSKSKLDPGLWVPFDDPSIYKRYSKSSQKSNLLCYSASIGDFVSPNSNRTASQSGLFSSLRYFENTNSKFISDEYLNPAAQRVQVHSVDNTKQAVSASVMYLFSGLI